MPKKAREEAVNAIFSEYWADIFSGSVLCHASFIEYRKNTLYIDLISIPQVEFGEHMNTVMSLIKGIIGDDLKKVIY